MTTKMNEVGLLIVNIPAVVSSIKDKIIELKNDRKTQYRLGTAEITYPNGEKEEVDARFYVKSIEAHPEIFKVGEKINLEIQVEGEFAGRAVAKLGGNMADVARLLGRQTIVDVEMTPAIQESIVSDNVIETELVV